MSLRRERAAATGDELLALSAEFERAKNRPAASVVRVGAARAQGAAAQEARGAAHQPPPPPTPLPTPTPPQPTLVDTDVAVGAVAERTPAARASERVPWRPRPAAGGAAPAAGKAFPRAFHRSERSFGRRRTPAPVAPSETSAATARCAEPSRGSDDAAAVSVQNARRLAAMSDAERAAAVAEAEGALDASTLDFLRRRGSKQTRGDAQAGANAGPRASAAQPQAAAAPAPAVAATSPAAGAEAEQAAPPAWPSTRFALSGEPLGAAASTEAAEATDGVRATERDPLRVPAAAAAGYTVDEALALVRSAVPAQRVAAMRLLAGAIGRAHAWAALGGVIGMDGPWEAAVLRGCEHAAGLPAIACAAMADSHTAVIVAGQVLALELAGRGVLAFTAAEDACAALPMGEHAGYGRRLARAKADARWVADKKRPGALGAMVANGLVPLAASLACTDLAPPARSLALRLLAAAARHSPSAAADVIDGLAPPALARCAADLPREAAALARALLEAARLDDEAARGLVSALRAAAEAEPSLAVRAETLLGIRAALKRAVAMPAVQGAGVVIDTLSVARNALLSASAVGGDAAVERTRAAGMLAVAAMPARAAAECGEGCSLATEAARAVHAVAAALLEGATAAEAACVLAEDEGGGGALQRQLALVAAAAAQLRLAAHVLAERPWSAAVPPNTLGDELGDALGYDAVAVLVQRVCRSDGLLAGGRTRSAALATAHSHALALLSAAFCVARLATPQRAEPLMTIVVTAAAAAPGVAEDAAKTAWEGGGMASLCSHLSLQRAVLIAESCGALCHSPVLGHAGIDAETSGLAAAITAAAAHELARLGPGHSTAAGLLVLSSLGHVGVARALIAAAPQGTDDGGSPSVDTLASVLARHSSGRLMAVLAADEARVAATAENVVRATGKTSSAPFGAPLAACGVGSSLPWMPQSLVLPLLPRAIAAVADKDTVSAGDAMAPAAEEPLRVAAALAFVEGARSASLPPLALIASLTPPAALLVSLLGTYANSSDLSLFQREGVAGRLERLIEFAGSGLPALVGGGDGIGRLEAMAGRLAERFAAASYGDEGFARAVALMLSPALSPSMAQAASWRSLADSGALRMLPPSSGCVGSPAACEYPCNVAPASDVLAAQEEAAREGRLEGCTPGSLPLVLVSAALGAVIVGEQEAPEVWRCSLAAESARRRALVGVLAGCSPQVAGAALLGTRNDKKASRAAEAKRLLPAGDTLAHARLRTAIDSSRP